MKKWSDVREEIRSVSDTEKEELRLAAQLVSAITEQRNRLGWSQRELATRAGIKQSALSRLESGGAIPRIDTLIKVARALGMHLSFTLEPLDDAPQQNS